MTKYDQICVLFKIINKDLYNWVLKRSQEEDTSKSAFIIRSLKKIRKIEESENEKKTEMD